MRRMYLQGVFSAVLGQVMQNLNGDIFWNEGSKRDFISLVCLFR